MSAALKEYRGKFEAEVIDKALKNFKLNPLGREIVRKYFVEGVRIKNLPNSKQYCFERLNKIRGWLDKKELSDCIHTSVAKSPPIKYYKVMAISEGGETCLIDEVPEESALKTLQDCEFMFPNLKSFWLERDDKD